MAESKFNFDRVKQNFEQLKERVPTLLANKAKNFFVGSFAKQGFDNDGVKPWKQVKRRIPGTPEYKYPKKKDLGRRTRAILVKSGRLRRGVQDSIRTANWSKLRLLVDVKDSKGRSYAQFHNEGSRKSHLPRRRFMGHSATLNRQLKAKFRSEVDKIWKA